MKHTVVTVLAALACAPVAAAQDVARPPVAVRLDAGEVREWVGPRFPAGARNRFAQVAYRTFVADTSGDWGRPSPTANPECRWRGSQFNGSWDNVIVTWVDACGPRPRVRMLSTLRTVRVSVQVFYDHPRRPFGPRDPEPVEADPFAGLVLVCEWVPEAEVPADASSSLRTRVALTQALVRGVATP